MRDDRALDPPAACRWLVRVASWIVPRGRRPEWRRKWEDGVRHWWAFLVERGELCPEARARLVKHCWSAWADALRLRFDQDDLRRFLRGPAFVLSCAAVFLVALGLLSRGFAGIRGLWIPLPYESPGQLYSFSLAGLTGQDRRLPVRQLRAWREKSVLTSGLAAYVRRGKHAEATPDFFSLLGVRPLLGRTLQAGDEAAAEPAAVLNYGFWRERFGGDRAAVGRKTTLDGRTVKIAGVLPSGFWAVSQQVQYWTPLALEPPPVRLKPPYDAGAVTRIKPGASPEKVRAELLAICGQEKLKLYGPGLRLMPLEHRVRGLLIFFAVGLVFAVLIGAVLISSGRPFFSRRGGRREGWRYWAFFLLKTPLVLASVVVCWIELTSTVRFRLGGFAGDLFTVLVINWAFYLGCAGALYWCFHDQRRRCPVCLHRLTMPVTIGSWSSPLLDPVSTELLCEQGHGSLCVPETQSSASETGHWTALDESWRELFTK
jgi:MacB-like periplasmic core domain